MRALRFVLLFAWRAFVAVLLLSLALVIDELLSAIPVLERRVERLVPFGNHVCHGGNVA